jgi:hypothetical protein
MINAAKLTGETNGGTSRNPRTYHCGTLTYTKVGLVVLFAWLLWGDFCFTLMETVVPSVLPLKLKALGCSNLVMGLILSTIPGLLNMTICPYVSFKSDRYRSKWGRRNSWRALLGCSGSWARRPAPSTTISFSSMPNPICGRSCWGRPCFTWSASAWSVHGQGGAISAL